MLRAKVAKKLSNFLRTSQEEEMPNLDLKDEDAPELPTSESLEEELPEDEEGDLDEGDLEEEKEEVSLEDLADTLESVDDKLDDIVEGLESQKGVLEDDLGEDVEEEFEELTEDELGELEDEELTPEEFGVDLDELITSKEKEAGVLARKLRANRKVRLLKRAEAPSKTLSEEFDEPKSTKKTFSPINPEVKITKVPESEVPTLFKASDMSLELADDKSKWVVMDKKDKPLFEITCDAKTATKDFAVRVIKDMKTLGVLKAMRKYNASKVGSRGSEIKVNPKTALNDYKRKFVRAFRLALTAMHKNLTESNPLKAAMYNELVDGNFLDGDTAQRVIEAAFAVGAVPHFEAALAETDKYLDNSDEAFIEIESTIGDMQVKPIEVEASEEPESASLSERALRMQARAKKASLPLTTASDSADQSELERLQSALPMPALAGTGISSLAAELLK